MYDHQADRYANTQARIEQLEVILSELKRLKAELVEEKAKSALEAPPVEAHQLFDIERRQERLDRTSDKLDQIECRLDVLDPRLR